MSRTLGIFFALVIVAAGPSAKAGGTVNIKCGPNEDRVWVYESLTDFNVAAKLKCGDPVQIVDRVKGYVKIQTANGTEGYVLDTNFPKSVLPPEPVEKPNTVESAAAAFAARRSSRSEDYSVDAPANVHSSASVAVANAAPPAVAKPIAASQPQPQPQPVATISAPVAATSTITVEPQPTAPAPAMVAKNSNSVPATNSIATSAVSGVQPVSVRTSSAAPAPAPQPAPVSAPVVVAPRANPVVAVSAPAPSVAPPSHPAALQPVSHPVPVAAAVANPPAAAPAPAPSVASNASRMTIETSASPQPVADATPRVAPAPVKPPVNPDDEEDTAVNTLNNEMANCTLYFSAYGLSANQYKWLAQNRHKAFPSVCPAPTPAQVDFVVIFTHDVAFYNVTMPNAVHTDVNGFSDWTPLTTVDTAVISATDADKSHHEYVWVFHTNRGAFDPAKFSARRRPLYSKAETNTLGSRGGFRTVMDALTFIEQNGTSR